MFGTQTGGATAASPLGPGALGHASRVRRAARIPHCSQSGEARRRGDCSSSGPAGLQPQVGEQVLVAHLAGLVEAETRRRVAERVVVHAVQLEHVPRAELLRLGELADDLRVLRRDQAEWPTRLQSRAQSRAQGGGVGGGGGG